MMFSIIIPTLNEEDIIAQTIKQFDSIKDKYEIEIIISTGGYMSLPACLVAKILNLKIYLFEPNMVIGRLNKFFLRYCKKIFCYSDELLNFPKKHLTSFKASEFHS